LTITNRPSYATGDIITAEATPPGRGGISVIRISGAGARKLAAGWFDRDLPEPGRHRYGRLIRRTGDREEVIDEVVLACYGAPHSYTGEELIEISVHGSPVVVAEALDALYQSGARPAAPGEFTLRAFINGRMDLTQAEGVADLIAARSRQAADQARRQLQGGLGRAADEASGLVALLLTGCELELDFVEDDVTLTPHGEKEALVARTLTALDGMLAGYQTSRRLREGVRVAITGAPNVGKSSLFNALLGEPRAIVHRLPGTTRDAISAGTVIGGIAFELFDTAGLHETGDEVEDEGIRRALQVAETADLKLVVSAPDAPESAAATTTGEVIKIWNKCDLGGSAPEGSLAVSALTGEGVDKLKSALCRTATGGAAPGEGTVSRERHYNCVIRARGAMQRAGEALRAGQPAEVVAEELREALAALDELTGKRRLEALLEEIFSSFCIGK